MNGERETNMPDEADKTNSNPPANGGNGGGGRKPKESPIGEVIIEVGDKRNNQKMFSPTRTILRGSWAKANLVSDERVEQVETIPDIPGIRILISPVRRTALIFDPMSLPENTQLNRDVQEAIKKNFGTQCGPMEKIAYEDMSDTAIKTWLYYMRRMVDGSKTNGVQWTDAKIVAGSLPTMAEIKALPGMIEMEHFNASAIKCRYKEYFPDYLAAISKIPKELLEANNG